LARLLCSVLVLTALWRRDRSYSASRSVPIRLEIGRNPRRDRFRAGCAPLFSGSRNLSISRHLGLRGPQIWMLTCSSGHPSGRMGGFEDALSYGVAGDRQLQALNW